MEHRPSKEASQVSQERLLDIQLNQDSLADSLAGFPASQVRSL